ncbi:MAG TPA: DUF1080 domain-containing protein [Verrucomicrobiae bacterium]|nr:DUF1080 domain-containing protein [Verrucomicrobiae bacterium]
MKKILPIAFGLLAATLFAGCATTKSSLVPAKPSAPTATNAAAPVTPPPMSQGAVDDFAAMTPIFDGKTLDGWIDQENSDNMFGGGDIKDLQGLAQKLVDKSDPVSAWLNDKLGTNMEAVADYLASPSNAVATVTEEPSTNSVEKKKPRTPPSKEKVVSGMLARNLTEIISEGPVYDAARFANVQLRPETQALLQKNPEGVDLLTLNKMLIEDAYPTELSKTPRLTGWTVTNGVIASTGAGRGTLFTAQDYSHYRLTFLMRHVSGNHEACVLVFCRRPGSDQKLLDALGGIQFQVPNGGHWDYRPGINSGGKSFSSPTKTHFNKSEWSRVEIVVNAQTGVARMAVAQPPGTRAVENLDFKEAGAGVVGPIALQMHNAGLFDEYKDIKIEVDPPTDDLLSTK